MLLAACVAVLLAACGGEGTPSGSETSSPAGGDSTTAPAPGDGGAGSGTSAPGAAGGSTPADTGAGSSSSSGDAGSQGSGTIRDVLAQLSEGPARVTYDVQGGDLAGNERLTIVRDGERYAIRAEGPDGQFYSLVDGDGTVFCQHDGEWSCLSMEPDEGDSSSSLVDELLLGAEELEDADLEVINITSETILGRDAVCIEAAEDGDVGEICIDRQTSALLRATGESDGEPFSMIAVEFAAPTAADFTPPAEPMDFAELLGGMFPDPPTG